MLYTKLSYDHQKVSWYQGKSFLSILSMTTLVFWTGHRLMYPQKDYSLMYILYKYTEKLFTC